MPISIIRMDRIFIANDVDLMVTPLAANWGEDKKHSPNVSID